LDIQSGVYYYDSFSEKLGEKFYDTLVDEIKLLENYALAFQVRYDEIRLLHIKGFPYSVHYSVYLANNTVVIEAVIAQKEGKRKINSKRLG
jgi:hypothetical protein